MRPPRNLFLIGGVCVILALAIWLITSLGWLYSQIAWSAPPFLAGLLVILLTITIGVVLYAFLDYTGFFRRFPGFGAGFGTGFGSGFGSGLGSVGAWLDDWWGIASNRRRSHHRSPPRSRPLSASRSPSRSRLGSAPERRALRAPADKTDAATANLKAVRRQVSQIQDEVTRRALLSRSREIEQNMERRNVQIVVFGTGSAGKTSLINALLGRVVGQVAAPMGSTQEGQVFTLKLNGVAQAVEIVDTPGILEAGEAGGMRSQVARQWAAEADLLIFVVDNDLTQAEFSPLIALAEIGKRSIVAFNKTDLYPEADREIILANLRSRLRRWIPPSDIVAISSNPPSVRIASGEVIQPSPQVLPLIRRIIAVLRAEGADLVADNILLQSQRLGDRARQLIDAQRRRQAVKIVERYQWIGAGAIAVTPLPVVDLLATVAVNAQMVVEIAKIYGCELNLERGRELAFSLGKTLASLGIVKGAVQLIASALALNPATLIVGKAVQGITAAYLTRIAGKSFMEYFRQDQDWGDGGMTEVVQRQFQLTRKEEFLKAFVKDAMAKVVEPLKLSIEPEALDEGFLLTDQEVTEDFVNFATFDELTDDRDFTEDNFAGDDFTGGDLTKMTEPLTPTNLTPEPPIAPFSLADLARPEPPYRADAWADSEFEPELEPIYQATAPTDAPPQALERHPAPNVAIVDDWHSRSSGDWS